MLQFWHSIYVASPSGGSTRRMTDLGKMEPEFTIQGYKNNRVFFAEKNQGRSDIYMLKLRSTILSARKIKVFELQSKMIAMENDNCNKIIQ